MTQRPAPQPRALPVRRRRLLAGMAGVLAGATGSASAQSGAPTPQGGEAAAPPPPLVGTRLALPEIPLLDGSVLRPADLAGQVVVLYWWASWCPFCAVQSPHVDALWRAQRARGLRVVGLSIDRRAEEASAYLARKGYGFPSAWLSPALARALPKPKGLPVTVVLGRDGRVVMSESGQLFPEDVEGIARFV